MSITKDNRESGLNGYYQMTVLIKGRRIRKGNSDLNYLQMLQEKLIELRSNGGSFEEAQQLVADNPAPERVRKQYYGSVDRNPMLYISIGYRRKPTPLQPTGEIVWLLNLPWDGQFLYKHSHDLVWLKGLRDVLLVHRNAGDTFDEAKQIVKDYPKPPKPSKRTAVPAE